MTKLVAASVPTATRRWRSTTSTVSGNSTRASAGGGGISGSYVTLTDSTVSGNSTRVMLPVAAGSTPS